MPQHISELDTPALLIDLDRMEANLRRAADYAAGHNLKLRPHTKTHKSPVVGKMQLDLGAVGLTVAKVGEAEIIVKTGTPELLVAYPIIGEAKLKRLMDVAKQTRIIVGLDDLVVAQGLSAAAQAANVEVGVFLEANLGMDRVGVEPGPALVELGKAVSKLPNLSLDGVEFYSGHINKLVPGWEEKLASVITNIQKIRQGFARAGIELKTISGGSTPMLFHSHEIEGLTEIRPGTYVFYDVMQVSMGAATWDDCAASIMTTVISTARPGFAVIDGGSKTFTSDNARAGGDTFGRVIEAPESRFYKMNEEHGYLEIRDAPAPLRIGDRLRIIPNHVCVAVNMHAYAYGIRGETVEQVWKVEGRGKLQ
ncbi:MAG: alanine racemase [Acidobacteria bacterium]|nr:alanine racemase [Acidobacteriota bacterium]